MLFQFLVVFPTSSTPFSSFASVLFRKACCTALQNKYLPVLVEFWENIENCVNFGLWTVSNFLRLLAFCSKIRGVGRNKIPPIVFASFKFITCGTRKKIKIRCRNHTFADFWQFFQAAVHLSAPLRACCSEKLFAPLYKTSIFQFWWNSVKTMGIV